MCAEWDSIVEEITEGVKRTLWGLGENIQRLFAVVKTRLSSSLGQVTADNGEQ